MTYIVGIVCLCVVSLRIGFVLGWAKAYEDETKRLHLEHQRFLESINDNESR